MLEPNRFLKPHRFRRFRFQDIGLGIQYRINPLQRSHSLTYAIGGSAQIFRGIDNRIENNQIINERSRINSSMVAEDQQSSEP